MEAVINYGIAKETILVHNQQSGEKYEAIFNKEKGSEDIEITFNTLLWALNSSGKTDPAWLNNIEIWGVND
jgi:hypothetical protein